MDVLIVDDERTFAELLAERLRLRGYAVRVAGTAEAALEQMEDATSDVALLDVGLPGMDGLSLLERIRGLWPGTACCMLTGASQVDVAARALRHGAFDWLAKPVSLACVEDVLARAQARQREAREQELLAEAARMRSLDRLTEGIAHEVNNPVNIMVQAAGEIEDLMMEVPEDAGSVRDEILEAVDVIKRQSRRVRELTRTLLVLGRGLDAERRGVDLRKAAEEVLGVFSARMQDSGVTAKVSADPGMPSFLGSQTEIRQIFIHLVENALDAMPDGGNIEIACRVRPASGPAEEALFGLQNLTAETDGQAPCQLVEIKVRDTGHGVARQIEDDLFQPFFTTREVGAGKGLGLAVCKSLVEKRGGTIRLESSRPGGTEFGILLPFEAA